MNELREKLIDRMIRIYGFEHEIVLDFCKMCKMDCMSDQALTTIVECHEEYPITEDGKILGDFSFYPGAVMGRRNFTR